MNNKKKVTLKEAAEVFFRLAKCFRTDFFFTAMMNADF